MVSVMPRYHVDIYTAPDGTQPVVDYMRELARNAPNQVTRIISIIELLRDYGPDLREPYTKALGGGLFELRTTGGHAHRIVYSVLEGPKFILLHAFYKTKPRMPEELEKARRRMVEYLGRLGRKKGS